MESVTATNSLLFRPHPLSAAVAYVLPTDVIISWGGTAAHENRPLGGETGRLFLEEWWNPCGNSQAQGPEVAECGQQMMGSSMFHWRSVRGHCPRDPPWR